MSFGTPYPYGTPGGDEVIATAQNPPAFRVAQGNSVIVFLHVNGRLAERLRENVEDVVRVLGLTGTVLVAIIVREEGVVRDANASDMDFQDGLTVTQIAPGVVTVEIGAAEVTTGMLQDALITAIKMAPNSVETAAIKDANVTLAKLAPSSVDSSKIVNASIVGSDLAGTVGGTLVQTISEATGHSTSSNSSTVTWATHLTVNDTLPSGTWECSVIMNATYTGHAGGVTTAESRIGSPIVGTVRAGANAVGTDRFGLACVAHGTFVSDGVTPTVFTGEYRRFSGDTVRADSASLIAVCVRVA